MAQLASDNGHFLSILARKEVVYVANWCTWNAQWKSLDKLERRCQDISQEIQMFRKKDGRAQCKSEQVKDCTIKSLKK